jgi:hypothetical protein
MGQINVEIEEATKLSQHVSLDNSGSLLLEVKTDWYILDYSGMTKKAADKMVDQLNGRHAGRAIRWKTYQWQYKLHHLILIADDEAATLARMFADGHNLRKLTIGELREARNVVDIPWLPPIKGYLDIRAHNSRLSQFIGRLDLAWEMQRMGHEDLAERMQELRELIKSKLKPLPPSLP